MAGSSSDSFGDTVWEYVPLVLLAYGARVYDIDPSQALIWDGLALATMGGIWLVTRRDITLCDASPEAP